MDEIWHAFSKFIIEILVVKSLERAKSSESNTAWSEGKMSDTSLLCPKGLFFVLWLSFLPSFISAVSNKMKD